MYGVLAPSPLLVGYGRFPAVNLVSAEIQISPSPTYGYAAAGGYLDTLSGLTGGALSGSLLAEYVTTDIVFFEGLIAVALTGNAVAALAPVTHLLINGASYALSSPPEYDAPRTIMLFGASLAAGAYTIKLLAG